MFKRNGLWAGAALLVAGAGALAATYVYLRNREEALDEYEELLFEDFAPQGDADGELAPEEDTHFDGDFSRYETED